MLLSLLRTYLRPYRWPIAALMVLQVVQTVANLYLPRLNADIIDKGVAVGDTAYIWRVGAVMLLVALVQLIAVVAAMFFGARTAMSLGRDIRGAVFERVTTFSARELNQFGAASLITRTTNDVQQVQTIAVMGLNFAASAPITVVGGVIMALREDAGLTWLLAVIVPAMIVSLGSVVIMLVPRYRAVQKRIDRINQVLREQIAGVRVVRAFVRESFEERRFAEANDSLFNVNLQVGRLQALMFPMITLIFSVSSVAVLWFGSYRVGDGDLMVGQLLAFLTYLTQILMSVMFATFMASMIPRAAVCADRIGEVLDTFSSVTPPAKGVTDVRRSVTLELDHAGFHYPGAETPVLRDISLTLEPGKTTAIIGSTGSGKTTLLGLVPRLFDATTGAVRIGGVDVRELDPALIPQLVALVPQRPYLFSGTIASNLRYGNPDASDDELWDALRVAQGEAFVREHEEGLETAVAQGGTNFSGGQRQRLAIARALVAKPDIYLFDDSFSALDLQTEAKLRAALKSNTDNAGVLVVAQRVSTIIGADEILVLDDGAVVGQGTHTALLETCAAYQEIVASQITEEDVA